MPRARISPEKQALIRELRTKTRAGRPYSYRQIAKLAGVSHQAVKRLLNCYNGNSVTIHSDLFGDTESDLNPKFLLILGAIAAGAKTVGEIAQTSRVPYMTVWKRLERLMEDGIIRRVQTGFGPENHIVYRYDLVERAGAEIRERILADLNRLAARTASDPRAYGVIVEAMRTVKEAA